MTEPVPGFCPVAAFAPKPPLPKPPLLDPNPEVVLVFEAPPNRPPPVVLLVDPKPDDVLLLPELPNNVLPPVLLEPKPLLVFDPKPPPLPKPLLVLLVFPNRPPPVELLFDPKAGRLLLAPPPKRLVELLLVFEPNPVDTLAEGSMDIACSGLHA